MPDNTTNSGSQDRDRVNLNQPHEVVYWTNKWGISADQLRNAVGAVGVMAANIEVWLEKNKTKG